jgi:glycosyltransferase involved in cell wall biosynthesis
MEAEPPLFSLVVASVGRTAPLEPLFESLRAQQGASFEVILVDQNEDDRLVPVVAHFAGLMPIRHVLAERINSSVARNDGLPFCTGRIVGFPDDDCLYPPGTLARVAAAFAADPDLGVLTGPAQSPDGGLGSGRWATAAAAIGRDNAFLTVICFNLFLRREVLERLEGFDPALGVGAEFGSCEENDLVLRAIESGTRARYDPALRVVHPDKRLSPEARDRAFRYGAGFGYVLRKHHFGIGVIGTFLIRPFGGVVVSLLRRRWLAAGYYRQTLRGRWYGYRAAARRART